METWYKLNIGWCLGRYEKIEVIKETDKMVQTPSGRVAKKSDCYVLCKTMDDLKVCLENAKRRKIDELDARIASAKKLKNEVKSKTLREQKW